MNSLRNAMGAAAVRILAGMMDRPSSARLRRFRPLAESMEARALLSHVALNWAIIDSAAVGHGSAAVAKFRHRSPEAREAAVGHHLAHRMVASHSPLSPDEVEVNGQVEIDPGDD